MNFLAHALLADHSAALRVGGVVGDFIKGPLPGALPNDLATGVALHRAIDSHADQHPAFRRSRLRLAPALRRWSGVMIDIYYDHLLARDWNRWHTRVLSAFNHDLYAEITARMADFPPPAQLICARLCDQDWLTAYADPEGIRVTLAHMGQRVQRENPLAGSEQYLFAQLPEFEADCREFLTDAQDFAARWVTAQASR